MVEEEKWGGGGSGPQLKKIWIYQGEKSVKVHNMLKFKTQSCTLSTTMMHKTHNQL